MVYSLYAATGLDMDILLRIQAMREASGYALDSLANAITFIGDVYPIMIIMALFYWCLDKRTGLYMAMSAGFANFVGNLVKCVFCVYRPWVRNPAIRPVKSAVAGATGYSFPSGHTVNAVAVYGAGAVSAGKRRMRAVSIISALLAVLIALSRLYCEVHTPQDVLVGALLGLVFLFVSYRLIEAGEKADDKKVLYFALAMTFVTALGIAFVSFKSYPMDLGTDGALLADPAVLKKDAYKMSGVFLGLVWGYYLEHRFVRFNTDKMDIRKALIRLIPGILGLVILAAGIGKVFDLIFGYLPGHFITYTLVGAYCLGFYPMLFTYLEKRKG